MRLCQLLSFRPNRQAARPVRTSGAGRTRPRLEALEPRTLLTTFTPVQLRHAYGFDRVAFADASHSQVLGDGSGMTIAVIDPYDDPNIASDLAHFDSTYGLAAPPSFTKVNQSGGTAYPAPSRGWAGEIALDVEYAHAMAPGATILLVEANDSTAGNLDTAVQYAATHGAVAVSMSYGGPEYSGETSEDHFFTHAGVTYFSATGDSGAPGWYQAFSPDVVAVGGTSLTADSSGNYISESGWSGSGGGISAVENQPGYQSGIVTQSSTRRTIPDVAFDADLNTGAYVYDTYGGSGLYGVGGTSLATPMMAGLAAVIDQGRSYLFGRSSYNGTDFLNALYHLPQADLNDITTGTSTGSPHYSAGPGYDLVTGRGTPIVDRFVSAMIGAPVINPLNNVMTVTGGGRGSNDTLSFVLSGGQVVVEVSAGTAVAGSSIPANQAFTFNPSQFSSVVIVPGDGTTTVHIDLSADPANLPLTLTTGSLSSGPRAINFGTGITALTITGGSGNNTYTINGTPASQGTTLNTGGGVDTVNVRALSRPLTVNSDSGSGADVIILGGTTNTLTPITGDVTLNAAPTDALVLNDQGFTGARTFTITDTALDWGGPTVTYAGLGSITVNGGRGGNTFDVLATSGTAAVSIIGNGSGDTLVGSSAGNLFAVTGADTGTLSGSAYGSGVGFSQVGNLTAGAGGDTFQFADGATLSGSLTGGGADTLDFSAYSTSVVVDLQTGFATGVSGTVSGIGTVRGGTGDGTLGAYNLLIGTGGNVLVGGTGRPNLLVAGGSASTLYAGDGQDLLIAGSTAYDTDPALANWLQIAAYWAGSDDYATRVANLTTGNGVPLLDATVVNGNGGGNTLEGNGGLALIYSDGLDNVLSPFDPGSIVIPDSP
jgi:hypothetical protein